MVAFQADVRCGSKADIRARRTNVRFASNSGHQAGRREAAGWHLMSGWRLPPIPFPGLPVVASDPALDHFVSPFVARHDERGEITAAEAKRAERDHNDDLQ
jgi:hypothetical protein